MKDSMHTNYIKNTPDFVYVPPQPLFDDSSKNEKSSYAIYITKFKTALYAFVLFLVLSSTSAYRILDIILKLVTPNIEIIDEDCGEPALLGRVIMGTIISIILFIL
jgi:hypothetical protein